MIETDKRVNEMVEVQKSPTAESNNANELERHNDDTLSAKIISTEGKGLNSKCKPQRHIDGRDSVKEANVKSLELTPIFDINYTGIEDKFANSILHVHQFTKNSNSNVNTTIHKKWRDQSQFDFGFVLLDEDTCVVGGATDIYPFMTWSKSLGSPITWASEYPSNHN